MALHLHAVGVALGRRMAFAPKGRKECGRLWCQPRTNPWCLSILRFRWDNREEQSKQEKNRLWS